MRKTILGSLIAGAFAVGSAQASLVINLTGSAGGPVISADALDWAPTSFLALGGNTAIQNFAAGACVTDPSACNFDILTHAKLTAYTPSGASGFSPLPGFTGEITMVARYTETVVGFGAVVAGSPTAAFRSTGAGWVEFYYSPVANSADVSGSGFNDGTLIGRLTGVTSGVLGTFTVDGSKPIVPLDSFLGDDFTGQSTVQGSGSQGTLEAGLTSKDLDPNFFLTTLLGFSLNYTNISIGLPYESANPSDCFNPNQSASAVGTSGLSSTCNTTHINGLFSDQNAADPGVLPVTGAINGFSLTDPDFVAQTDYNSAVAGSRVPEPGSLALVGLALAGLGASVYRRARAA